MPWHYRSFAYRSKRTIKTYNWSQSTSQRTIHPKKSGCKISPKWCEPVYRNRAINNRKMDPKFINTTAVPYGYGLIELNAMDLAEAYANNQITDEKLKEIASNLKEEDNPVLMILKFKN
ncbi:hypothetical protein [Parabacteroides goldsteinii]|uniref:hypothetical protein n=1 Tax=Parabacteroides goldsteinii TaxID=328812 RepID=UPI0022E2B760|nr:hypothetical protein [Parabacteroides goldsteinii]